LGKRSITGTKEGGNEKKKNPGHAGYGERGKLKHRQNSEPPFLKRGTLDQPSSSGPADVRKKQRGTTSQKRGKARGGNKKRQHENDHHERKRPRKNISQNPTAKTLEK